MTLTSIILTNDAAKRCQGGDLWFSQRDVIGRKPRIAGIARLIDRRRRFVAMAFVSPGSRYFLRVFSRKREDVGLEFWRGRIARAHERRASLMDVTDAFRVVHAEADGIPGVVIDKYNDVWAIQITSVGAETIKGGLIDIIVNDYAPAAVVEKDDLAIRKDEGLPLIEKVVFGSKRSTIVREGDQRFEVDVLAGQKTGAYLDYRAFRLRARELAFGRCLDAFCYEGWFACQIARRADKVIAADASMDAVDAARRNARINGHTNIEFVKADVLRYLKECGERFDFIHLDPPAFAKGRAKLDAALRGYRRMIADALKLLKPGGIIMVSACSHAITEGIIEKTAMDCMRKAGRKGEVIYRGIQDRDHPVLKGHPESLYLKAIALIFNIATPAILGDSDLR